MDRAENKRGVIVGIFLALGILILIGVIYTLGGSQKRFIKSVTVTAVFDDVQGLKTGNNVWFSGVKIGTVKKIDFVGQSEVLITMNIEAEAQKYIHKNARAKIGSEGFIGNRIVVIIGGTPAAAIVEDGDKLVAEHALTSDEILDTLQANNKNLLVITNHVKVLSEQIVNGKGLIGAVLTDESLAQRMRASIANLETASRTAAGLSRAANEFAEKMNTKGGLADKVFTDTTVFTSLKSSADRLNQLTVTANGITDDFKKASSRLNDKDNAAGVLLNDPEAAKKIQSTLTNLDAASKKLDEDLEALQHNFLLRGFFKNRDKN